MKVRHLGRALVGACLVATMVAACGSDGGTDASGNSGELKTVRFGGQKVAADAGLFIADSMGFFKDQGIKFEYTRLNDASAITNSLATGHLDVAGATITPGTFQAVAKGLGIKIVGDKNYQAPANGDRPAVSASRLAVLPKYDKGDIKSTLEALRGKKIAIHSKLSIQIVYLTMLLEKYGFKASDFKITPVLSPDQTAALKNGAIDAAVMQEPYFTQAVEAGIVKQASDLTEELPSEGASMTAVLYSKTFLQNKDTAQKFMNAYIRGVRVYNDAMVYGKDKDKVVKIIAEGTNVPEKSIADSHPAGLDPDQKISLEWLQYCEDFYTKSGDLDAKVNVADMVDTSFRDNAVKELGQYEPPAS